MNVKKTKKFKENRPENYHVHDTTLELLYTEDLDTQQNASISSTPLVPPSSLPTYQLYQTPPVEVVTALVLVPEDIQLPSPSTTKDEIVCPVLPPCAPSPSHQVSSQHCWMRHKADHPGPSGAGTSGRLFSSSTAL